MTTNNFHLDYNVIGKERKRLVQTISKQTGADAKYLGAPTFAYAVDYFTVDRNGMVTFDDRADSEEIEELIEALAEAGFEVQASNLGSGESADSAAQEGDKAEQAESSENNAKKANAPQDALMGFPQSLLCGERRSSGASEPCRKRQGEGYEACDDVLTVRIPLEKVAAGRLLKLLDVKGSLIKNALGIDDLPICIEETSIAFPWFKELPTADEVNAYTHFISALCEMSKNQKRITATEKVVDNEKYAFRCFLLRLGFIGAEYKTERKILLRNLSGSSAFKSGHKGGADDDISE